MSASRVGRKHYLDLGSKLLDPTPSAEAVRSLVDSAVAANTVAPVAASCVRATDETGPTADAGPFGDHAAYPLSHSAGMSFTPRRQRSTTDAWNQSSARSAWSMTMIWSCFLSFVTAS